MDYELWITMAKKNNLVKDKSFEFAIHIVKFCNILKSERKETNISRQLLRSGTSIGANVREAINAQSTPDFIHKLSISQKECDETIYWLDLLNATGYMNEQEYNMLSKEAESLLRIIKSIILTTKSNNS